MNREPLPVRLRPSVTLIASAIAGGLFAVGLAVGGMTSPANVIGFLDLFGDFRPALLFVMVGAIAIYSPVYWLVAHGRTAPFLAPSFILPTAVTIDRRLLVGSVLFGVGWGLAGYCPGPALTSLGTGSASVLGFVAAMVVGMAVARRLEARGSGPSAGQTERPAGPSR